MLLSKKVLPLYDHDVITEVMHLRKLWHKVLYLWFSSILKCSYYFYLTYVRNSLSFKMMILAFINMLCNYYLFNLDIFSVWSQLVWIRKTLFVYGTGEKESCYPWLLVIQTE